jgi:hypothetical protein
MQSSSNQSITKTRRPPDVPQEAIDLLLHRGGSSTTPEEQHIITSFRLSRTVYRRQDSHAHKNIGVFDSSNRSKGQRGCVVQTEYFVINYKHPPILLYCAYQSPPTAVLYFKKNLAHNKMPKLKGYGSAAAVAATCFWALFLTTGENVSNVDAFVAPKTRQHHQCQCNLPFSVTITPTMTTTTTTTTTTSLFLLSKDLHQKMKYLDLERTGKDVDHTDEAAVSASLYMNPAASKLAPHVQVSWEPDAAKLIKQLAKISNPSRPLMVGVVGIPGSGKSTSCETLAAYLEDEVEAMVMPM